MDARSNLRRVKGAATRRDLIAAARRLFAEGGFHATGTNDLVAAAGVTRGALYYHFKDKEALFEAVFKEVAAERHAKASLIAAPYVQDRWRQLQEGLQAHLQIIAQSREMRRILVVDGPAVFGWSKWQSLQAEFSFGSLVDVFQALVESQVVAPYSPTFMAHLVLAALNEAALLIADGREPAKVGEEVGEILRRLIGGLR